MEGDSGSEHESMVSDLDHGDIEPVSRMEHFKVEFDGAWDYQAILERMFDGGKALAMLEKARHRPHVHFQGLTLSSERTFKNMRVALAATHFTRKPLNPDGTQNLLYRPKSRPTSALNKPATPTGFQYMCKEGHGPLARIGFDDDEIAQLKFNSDNHVASMKQKMRDYLIDAYRQQEGSKAHFRSPEKAHIVMALLANKFLVQENKDPSPHTKRDILNAMRQYPGATQEWIAYAILH